MIDFIYDYDDKKKNNKTKRIQRIYLFGINENIKFLDK